MNLTELSKTKGRTAVRPSRPLHTFTSFKLPLPFTTTVALTLLAPIICAQQVELEELFVTADRLEEAPQKVSSQSVVTVSAEELLKAGSIDLVDALQREPGVSIPFDFSGVDGLVPFLEGGSNSINVRGLEGNRVQILVDGIRQPENFTARSFLGAGGPGRIYFDPAVFSQIQIIKSASSGKFGSDALAGSVSGQTESPFTLLGPDLEGRTLRSTTNWASVNQSLNQRLATAIGNGDHALSVVSSYRLGQETENNSNLRANPLDFESYAVVVKGVSRVGELTIEPTFDYFRLDAFTDLESIETTTLVGENIDNSSDSTRERLRASLDLTWEPAVGFKAFDTLALKGYYQDSRSENFNRQKLLIDPGQATESIRDRTNDLFYETTIVGASLDATKTVDIGPVHHLLQYGYDFSSSDVSSALLRTDLPAAPENLVNMAPATVLRNGLHFTDQITFGASERLTLTPSLRVEDYRVSPDNTADFLAQTQFSIFDSFGRLIGTRSIEAAEFDNFSFTPSLSANYKITDTLAIFGSSTLGTRNPSAEELTGVFQHEDDFITLPNPGLQEETSFSNEIGIRFENDVLSLEVVGYWNFYQDFLESGVTTGEFIEGREIQQTQNRDEVEIYGGEISLEWLIGDSFSSLSGLSVGTSGSWSQGYQDDPDTGRDPLNTIEPWKATAWIGYQHPSDRWGLNLTGSYHAAKEERDISGGLAATQGYTLLDVTSFVKVGENLTLRAGLKNLLDQEYILWSRANRGSGHNGGASSGRDTQPGINGFLSVEFQW